MQVKNELRSLILEQRNRLDKAAKKVYDERLSIELGKMIARGGFQNVHCYLPIGSEIDLIPLLEYLKQVGIRVICPKTLPNRKLQHLEYQSKDLIKEGLYKTYHPEGNDVYTGPFDLIIVPGVAFDLENFRLGYGGGYYDTFLNSNAGALTLGVAYPFQVLTEIPREEHDVKLDKVFYFNAL